MSYVANLHSAQTYFKAGRPELAQKSLLRAYAEVPDCDKHNKNSDYLKILALLGKGLMAESKPSKAIDFIDQGLSIKNDHIDLMFLKMLHLFDMKKFDEMLAFIGLYLIAQENQPEGCDYEFSSEKALNEVFKTMLPKAYINSVHRDEIEEILLKLKEASGSNNIQMALDHINEIKENVSWPSANKT